MADEWYETVFENRCEEVNEFLQRKKDLGRPPRTLNEYSRNLWEFFHDVFPDVPRDMNRFVADDNEMVEHRFKPWGLPVGETSFQIFSEVDAPLCLVLQTDSRTESGEWSLAMRLNDNDPPELTDPERIEALEADLEQKEAWIAELEEEIDALEQELEAADGDVRISVEVSPSDASARFVEGGVAVVEATSQTADLARFAITYGDERYTVDESGLVDIPLSEPGTQQMTFSYGAVTEAIELEVAEADSERQADTEDTGLTDVSIPGFGVLSAVLAIVLAGLAARHRS